MAINTCVIMGRITREPELRYTQTNKAVLSFTVAVDRRGEDCDFIPCVAWENTAEFIAKYFKKGDMIGIEGRLQVRSYEGNDGIKRTVMEAIVYNASFTGSKRKDEPEISVTEDDGELPF